MEFYNYSYIDPSYFTNATDFTSCIIFCLVSVFTVIIVDMVVQVVALVVSLQVSLYLPSHPVQKKEHYEMNTANMLQRNDFSGHKISLLTGSLLPYGLTLNLVPSD